MYLSDLIADLNNKSNDIIGSINQKIVFNSNPIVKVDPINDNEVVTKRYLFKLFESIFGTNFYENKLYSPSPISVYVLNISDAECIEGESLIFEISISPLLIANLKIKLDLVSTSALPGVDYVNSFFYSEDNLSFTEIQNNIIDIKANLNKVYVKINTNITDEYYGDKILALKITEVVVYDSPENPRFVFNDVGLGKIKESKPQPTVYTLTVNNPNILKSEDAIFDFTLDKIISSLKIAFSINSLTASNTYDYDDIHLKYSNDDGKTWINLTNNELNIINTNKIKLKVSTFDRPGYQGDKVFLLNVNAVLNNPDNSIINVVNSISYATIREKYLPTIESYINVIDSHCVEGQPLVFETELVLLNNAVLNSTDQIIVYYNIKNITALSGVDYSEVMYWSYDNITYNATSTRQVIYTKDNLKVYIKFTTINFAAPNNKSRTLLLKPEYIVNKPNNINIKISDIAIGTINDITIPTEYYKFTLEDSIANEGDYIVFDLFSDNKLTSDITLLLQTSDITAINNTDYIKDNFQYSINQGSTWIDATNNSIIFHKDLVNIKIRLLTVKSSDYTGNRSFILKIKSIQEQPYYFDINYQDMAIGIIKDLENPPINYAIKFQQEDYSVKHGSDFIFKGYVYPPLRYDGLELKLNVSSSKAVLNTDYSFRFGKFSTNNGLTWSTISQANTIILNKENSYFWILIPTFQNLANKVDKDFKFFIDQVVVPTPNSNFDLNQAYVQTSIKV